jgi:hypothetical protein
LEWVCGTGNDVAGSSLFKVAKMPVGGCTETQLLAVAKIEGELEVPNAFGLNKEANAAVERQLAVVRAACKRSQILRKMPDLDYLAVTGRWGQTVPEDYIRGRVEDFVDQNGEFTAQTENRQAQVLDEQPAGDGVVEFLAYHKYGYWNLNIRWRPN